MGRAGWGSVLLLWNNSPEKKDWEGAESLPLCLLSHPAVALSELQAPHSVPLDFILYIQDRERASIRKCPGYDISTSAMEAALLIFHMRPLVVPSIEQEECAFYPLLPIYLPATLCSPRRWAVEET